MDDKDYKKMWEDLKLFLNTAINGISCLEHIDTINPEHEKRMAYAASKVTVNAILKEMKTMEEEGEHLKWTKI